MRIRWMLLTLGLAFTFAHTARADLTAESVWGHDFTAAEAEAAASGRPLVIHFHAKWCGPCKAMERDLLHTQAILKELDAKYVAVKVDTDKYPNLVQRFGIKGMPTDIVLSPEGKTLARTEGYDASTKAKYQQSIAKFGASVPKSAPASKEPKREIASASVPAATERVPVPADKLVPQPSEPRKVDVPRESVPTATTDDEIEEEPVVMPKQSAPVVDVAMDGYCPVTLRTSRTWKAGSKEFSLTHDGQVYYFTSSDKLAEFRANPDKFAPKVLGCDPVKLAESDLVVRGSTKFGAYYDGALYLFETNESRTKFKKTPTRYSQLKHTLKPEDVKRVASAAAN
ncbi:MAG: thioredoxin family protein [Planctomycetes bacterium]|nr:thioredoxin family protein [Planctomycetota bacterium]